MPPEEVTAGLQEFAAALNDPTRPRLVIKNTILTEEGDVIALLDNGSLLAISQDSLHRLDTARTMMLQAKQAKMAATRVTRPNPTVN